MAEVTSHQKKEVALETKFFRNWQGTFTQASRHAIPEDRFYNLENLIPIGYANAHSVPNISGQLVDYAADTVYWSKYLNLNGTDYLFNLTTTGKVFAYAIGGASTFINGGHLLSGAGSRVVQWKNSIALFIDSTGYYYFDPTGPTFAQITGTGVPGAGNAIAVFSGRVWIANGRVITISGVDDYTAPSFLVANGAAFLNLTDAQIRSSVVELWPQNGYLYVVSASAINAIADVYVPSGASPPTPVFTNVNIQSIIGTDQPASIHAMDRLMIFGNRYGAYALYGVDAQRLSSDIDGTWQWVDFTQAISGGAVVVQNILCAALLIKRANDPIFGSNTVIAMWFQDNQGNEKWWFANYGAVTLIASAITNNAPALFAFIGNKLYQLFLDTTTAPNGVMSTALWSMDDPLADKQVLRAGFEASIATSGISPFTMTLDSLNGGSTAILLNNAAFITWENNSGTPVLWQNNALAFVSWINGAYQLYSGPTIGGFQKYQGITVNTGGAVCELSGIFMDYKRRARWQQ